MEITAAQLAAMVHGEVEGDAGARVCDFAKIEEGRPGALSFLANPKYAHYIYDTESTVVLVSRDFVPEREVKATMVRVDDPYATIAQLLKMVQDAQAQAAPRGIEEPCHVSRGVEIPGDCYVGAFAYIGSGCKIGKGTKIYPQVYIGENCIIGDETIIYPGVKIYYGCEIGSRCIIHGGAVIGADGFGFAPTPSGYEKIPQTGNVVIEDDVEIGANTTIDRAMMGSTRICAGTKLDNLIQIGHNCRVGSGTVMAAQSGVAGSSKIGSSCMVGGQAGVAGHITVNDKVQIGAQSGITHDIPGGSVILGSPAISARDFARSFIYFKKLPALAAEIEKLKKERGSCTAPGKKA